MKRGKAALLAGTLVVTALTTAILLSIPSTIADETVTVGSYTNQDYQRFLSAGTTVNIDINVSSPGRVTLMILDDRNFNYMLSGYLYNPLRSYPYVAAGNFEVTVPTDTDYHFLIQNNLLSRSNNVSIRIVATPSVLLSSVVVFIVTFVAVLAVAKASDISARRRRHGEFYSPGLDAARSNVSPSLTRPALRVEGDSAGARARFSQTGSPLSYCSACGAAVKGPDWIFCSSCGASLKRQFMVSGASTEASERYRKYGAQKCMVCNMDLLLSDLISRCPHCGSAAHQMHLLEWLHVNGKCPVCGQHLTDREIVE